MCGIAGVLRFDRRPIEPGVVEAMTATLAHRGPDGSGYEHPEPWLGLGHRRLSIIDLEGGRQPLANETNDVWITYNGEIFNYLELRRELIGKGHVFRTHTDTEVIVHLYEEEGPACVERLNGQFAFALWDGRRLFCARDPFGIKPFYFYRDERVFAFASEPRAFLAMPGFEPEVDLDGLRLYFRYRFIPAPASALKGVRKLRAGEWLRVDPDGRLEQRRYWDLDASSIASLDDFSTARDLLKNKLSDAVTGQMIADVEVGAFLSGGIDSSSIVALMAAQNPASIHTFSLGFPQARYDERAFAREVGDHLGTDHTVRVLGAEEARALIPEVLDHMDEPFGDTAILPNYAVSKLARERVKVVLSGDGGDELFAGYGRYFHALHPLAVPPFLRPVLPYLKRRLEPPRSPDRWRYRDDGAVSATYRRSLERMTRRRRFRLYGPRLRERAGEPLDDPLDEVFRRVERFPPLPRLLAIDLHWILAEYHLAKVDRSSMQTSLEVRVPFLDAAFVQLAFRLTPELLLHGDKSKGLLREAMKGRLPPTILGRGKRGFGPPLKFWFGDDLAGMARERLTDAEVTSAGLVDRDAVERALTPRRSGKVNGALIWRLLVLESWYRRLREDVSRAREVHKRNARSADAACR
jgi:asparagine synthase (glutamine-hydrolysing)